MEISKERLEDLLDSEAKLQALEAGGVDNWEWYDESLESYRKKKELQNKKEKLCNSFIDSLNCIVAEADVSTENSMYNLHIVSVDQSSLEDLVESFLEEAEDIFTKGN